MSYSLFVARPSPLSAAVGPFTAVELFTVPLLLPARTLKIQYWKRRLLPSHLFRFVPTNIKYPCQLFAASQFAATRPGTPNCFIFVFLSFSNAIPLGSPPISPSCCVLNVALWLTIVEQGRPPWLSDIFKPLFSVVSVSQWLNSLAPSVPFVPSWLNSLSPSVPFVPSWLNFLAPSVPFVPSWLNSFTPLRASPCLRG